MFVNHLIDKRYTSGSEVVTHDLVRCSATSCELLAQVDVKSYDVVGIDEAQFFPDLLNTVQQWVVTLQKIV